MANHYTRYTLRLSGERVGHCPFDSQSKFEMHIVLVMSVYPPKEPRNNHLAGTFQGLGGHFANFMFIKRDRQELDRPAKG